MHDIEINKSFCLLVLFGNGYTASKSLFFEINKTCLMYVFFSFQVVKTVRMWSGECDVLHAG